jgi:hypothetical protein
VDEASADVADRDAGRPVQHFGEHGAVQALERRISHRLTFARQRTPGLVHQPDVAEVLDSAVFGVSSGVAGTYHAPDVAEVIDTATFGAASAESGTVHLPDAGEVIDTATFGPASATAGTFAIPAEADVEDGVFYGEDGTEFEGELVAGGGGMLAANKRGNKL